MRRVFTRPGYVALAAFAACIVFFAISWVPAVPLIGEILASHVPLSSVLDILAQLLASLVLDATALSLSYALALSLLVGINISLLVFYFKMYRRAPSSIDIAGGVGAMVATALGFGCAACGSIFLTSLFATIGGASLLALLPLHGLEFGLLGILLLVFSARRLSRAIMRPPVCPI